MVLVHSSIQYLELALLRTYLIAFQAGTILEHIVGHQCERLPNDTSVYPVDPIY
jgi:hypothetical protein